MTSNFTKEQHGTCSEYCAPPAPMAPFSSSPHPSDSPRPAPSIPPGGRPLTDPSGRTVVVTVHQE